MVALAAGKTYLTAGGYVVEIINDELNSSERTSPGLSITGRNILELNERFDSKNGWYYERNGTIKGLTQEWIEKLKIVQELPFPIPELPEGYTWADGYPQFREIKKNEYYVSNSYHQNPSKKYFFNIYLCKECSPASESKFGTKRFAVVKITPTPTPEPTKNTDPLITKYGEPEAGWRWLANDEEVQEGDEFKSPSLGYFVKSDNWRSDNNKRQGLNLQPYRRKIMIQSQQLGDPIITDSPQEAQVGEWVECIDNSDYENKLTIGKKYLVQEPVYTNNGGRFYKLITDNAICAGGWKVCRFKKASPEKEVVVEKVSSAYPRYYKHRDDDFSERIKYIKQVLVSAIAAANSKTLSPLKFPLYYQHKGGLNGDTKYVKRINESQYTVILKKDGKEVENEMYKWDKQRDQTVAEGTWIEVPEAEVNDFIASVTVTEANSTLVKKEEEKMNKENFVKVASGTARFAGNWGFKAANYWLFEPAANLGRPIVKGVRYAVFLGSLSAAVYGYNNPEMVKNAIKSCIPKITIEAPEVLKG